ncbi:MAG: glycosyltransferase family 4 protein [Actinomycetota bacterium]|nr:glycosyltransferase family 4 protein [Actinomycetota bacterium]
MKTSTGAVWAWRQVRELMALGTDVHVALPPGGDMVARYEDIGAPVHLLPPGLSSRGAQRLPAVLTRIRRLVTELRPDIVHMHTVAAALVVRAALGRRHATPRVFQVPGPLHLEHGPFRRGELATAGPLDRWLASCEHTRRLYLAAGVPEDRVTMSYYGTDVDRYAPGPRGRLRTELDLPEGTKVVGMVAFMYRPKRYLGQRRGLKGHEDLIDAVALCLRRRDDVTAVFVGGAWAGASRYEASVRRYGRDRCGDRAVFLGTRTDVADLYRDFDVAVHPSHSENVGGAVESLLMGVPTVATRVGGLPELVRAGETGWLVPPKSPADLCDALLDAMSHPDRAHHLASRGRTLAAHLFDVRRTAAEVRALYDRILGRNEPSLGRRAV